MHVEKESHDFFSFLSILTFYFKFSEIKRQTSAFLKDSSFKAISALWFLWKMCE